MMFVAGGARAALRVRGVELNRVRLDITPQMLAPVRRLFYHTTNLSPHRLRYIRPIAHIKYATTIHPPYHLETGGGAPGASGGPGPGGGGTFSALAGAAFGFFFFFGAGSGST